MSISDPIADMLTVVRNGLRAKKEKVDVVDSKMNQSILNILKSEGYIENMRTLKDTKHGKIRVYLKYKKNRPAIRQLKRISKPGLRIYAKKDKIPYVLRGLGIAIISTSSGVFTDRETRKLKLGGEVICFIW